MAKETSKKRPLKPFKGNEGVTFSKEYQPTPEAKRKGWQEKRAEKLMTQLFIEKLTGNKGEILDEVVESIITNAKLGNAKAIDVLINCIEEQITKTQIEVKQEQPLFPDVQKNNND
jgi:hypothetical protein